MTCLRGISWKGHLVGRCWNTAKTEVTWQARVTVAFDDGWKVKEFVQLKRLRIDRRRTPSHNTALVQNAERRLLELPGITEHDWTPGGK